MNTIVILEEKEHPDETMKAGRNTTLKE